MKPVRLTLQAFGPYAGREVIDFRNAVGSGLFGIYGQTGSGKSTIFSSMIFALFGEAAKEEQETMSLRSDHAAADLRTEVEFIFEVGGRLYFVRRIPDQMRPKQRKGSGDVKTSHEAWLFDATGIAVEDISEANPGKLIAEKKVSAVREAVSNILGYGVHHFRQIVLLPQGEFEVFLTAKTDERLSMLRGLFDVSVYRYLASKLKEDATTAERLVRQQRELCVGRLVAEGFANLAELANGLQSELDLLEAKRNLEGQAALKVASLTSELDVLRPLAALFDVAETATTRLNSLADHKIEMDTLSMRVRTTSLASKLVDLEKHRAESLAELVAAADHRAHASLKSAKLSEEASVAEKSYAAEKLRIGKSDELKRKRLENTGHLQSLRESNLLKKKADAANNLSVEARLAFEGSSTNHLRLTSTRQSIDDSLRAARQVDKQYQAFVAQISSLEIERKSAELFEKALTTSATAQAALTQFQPVYLSLKASSKEATGLFRKAEEKLAQAQALILATKLIPDQPCMVCGGTDHPAPATGTIENSGLDQAFREAKSASESAQVAEKAGAEELASLEATRRVRRESVAAQDTPARSLAEIAGELASIRAKTTALGPRPDIEALEESLADLLEQIAVSECSRDQLREKAEVVQRDGSIAADRYVQAIALVPLELRNEENLTSIIAEGGRALKSLTAAFEVAAEAAKKAHEQALASSKDVEAATAAESLGKDRYEKTRTAFVDRLEEVGITAAEYAEHKPYILSLEVDAAAVNEFATKIALAEEQKAVALAAIKGKKLPDLAPMNDVLSTAKAFLAEAMNSRAATEAKAHHLDKLKAEIADKTRDFEKLDTDTSVLRCLAANCNADNALRLDLETFAIGEMFDQVLVAANQRLGPMTSGRYSLEREVEGGGRSRRGLGIKVLDIYTGKSRSPATLSGGETFIAALALALGLSDVVESSSGKVHLDTIFIDEGFGSLDTDNASGTLEQVLQVLTNLVSQKRAIGIISHVPAVQEAIPNGFYVHKEANGSRVEIRNAI